MKPVPTARAEPGAAVAERRDGPERIDEVRAILARKGALRRFYEEAYGRFEACVRRCPRDGLVVELGSGGGFLRSLLPAALITDIVAHETLDRVVDARAMPFADASVRCFLGLNVFHHLPDVGRFLREVERCLVPRGRLFLIDQHVGPLSRIVYGHLHEEPFDPGAVEWSFPERGPLSGANGALAWMVFQRDRARLEWEFPGLRLCHYEPHTPLRYFLAGGLRRWSLLPSFAYGMARALDRLLVSISAELGCFVDIELERLP